MKRGIFYKARLGVVSLLFLAPGAVLAHPGNTASDGAHYCWTNCASWGEVYGERHYHGGGYIAPPTTTYKDWSQKYSIPYKFTTKEDPELPSGQTRTIQAGVDGEGIKRWRVTYTNGAETYSSTPTSQVLTKPITQITAIGTKSEVVVPSGINDDSDDSSGAGWLFLPGALGIGGYMAYRSLKPKP